MIVNRDEFAAYETAGGQLSRAICDELCDQMDWECMSLMEECGSPIERLFLYALIRRMMRSFCGCDVFYGNYILGSSD